MNLVEKLLKADKAGVEQLEERKMVSQKLSKILGEKNVEITIQEIPPRRYNQLTNTQYGENGEFLPERVFDAHTLICAEGIVEPNLKDKDLQTHFGASNPKELAEKLFKGECSKIAAQINKMCLVEEDTEKKLEN